MNPQERWMWWRSSIFQDWRLIKLLHFCCHQFCTLKEVPKPQRTIMSKTDWPNLVNPNSQSQQLELHTSHFLTTKLESWCDHQYLLWVLLNHSMGQGYVGTYLFGTPQTSMLRLVSRFRKHQKGKWVHVDHDKISGFEGSLAFLHPFTRFCMGCFCSIKSMRAVSFSCEVWDLQIWQYGSRHANWWMRKNHGFEKKGRVYSKVPDKNNQDAMLLQPFDSNPKIILIADEKWICFWKSKKLT